MKKFFITLMCVIMVVCFMPTVAMADVSAVKTESSVASVSSIGGATSYYDSLIGAVEATEASDIVTLLKDYTVETAEYTSYVMPENSVLDLGGNNLTVPFVTAVFEGKNITIQNGRFESTGDYAIWIGNGENKTSATLKNITSNGGVNVYVAQAVLENCYIDASEKEYYAVWGDNGNVEINVEITIKSETFIGGKKGAVVNAGDGYDGDKKDSDPTKITIQGGDFSGKVWIQNQGHGVTGQVVITGGTFSDLSALDYLGENADVTVKLDGHVNESITIPSGKKVTLDLNGQSITSTEESAVIVSKDSRLVVEDMSNGKTGSITGATVGIKMGNAPENGQDANSSLTINGGTISGGAFGISGNGNRHGTTIIVNNGNITGVATGIYHPQDGEITVKGGTITGGTGREIRSGKLTVEGGTITGTATPAESTANGNGTTTDGAGIAVAQHTTKKPINVIVKGGTIEGYSALYQSNPQNNPPEDVANVSIQVEGGNFNAINQGRLAVYSQNKTGFITGGTFSTDPTAYVPANSRYYVSQEGGKYVVRYSTPTITLPPTTPTDNVTNSGSTAADNASTNADLSGSTSTSNGTTTATVDKTTADKIVDKAVENKSTEVVIDATANTTTAANSTTVAQVTIPTETLGAIAEKTEADVTIKTDVAEVKMDNTAAAAVSEQAEGDTVQIVAEKVAEETDKVEFELKVVCSDGKVISNFNGGNIAVTVALPKAMAEKKVVCVYIDDNGHMSKVKGQKNADGTYTFVTGHFSSYAILAEEEVDAAIAAQKEAIKNIEIKLTSKLVKTKGGKKGIMLTWTTDAADKKLDGIEIYRSTQRYKGYGTKPFYATKNGKTEGYYINTKSLKKGTRYYYRVRGYILVGGQKVYTDYSTKAWRTVK